MQPLIAVAPLGLEKLAAREIRALGGGIGKTKVEPTRVTFQGPADAVYRANLHLRLAHRILRPVVDGYAPDFEQMSDLVRGADWAAVLPRDLPLRMSVSTKACRLYHTGAIEECVREALVKSGIPALAPDEDYKGPAATVDLRGSGNRWVIAVDTSGRGLHRRSYRRRTGKAPLRENLAAALLFASGWTGKTPFLDPFCGAGTIAIEAALLARNRAPGLDRDFVFEHAPYFDAERWGQLIEAARARESIEGCPPIEASDQAGGAMRAAQENGTRAGVLDVLRLERRPVEDIPAVEGPGLIIANPPFGVRIEGIADLAGAWKKWGDLLRERRPGWRILLLAPGRELAEAAGATARPLIRFPHGGIDVGLYEVAKG
jgi:putative N6-adenine-specific DNA methylase